MNNLTNLNSQSRDLAVNPDPKYLLNTKNGRVFLWQPMLAVNKDFVDCDADGNPTDGPTGDDPYIQQETKRVADTMFSAGAEKETVAEFGNELARRAQEKFKSLGSGGIGNKRISQAVQQDEFGKVSGSACDGIDPDDSYNWVYQRIDEMAKDAMSEINCMVIVSLSHIADREPLIKPTTEVSHYWQIKQLREDISSAV